MAEIHDLGRKGEDEAKAYLRSKGYEILEENWRFRKMEIDIIARDSKQIVFIEVKTRANNNYGQPFEFVSRSKQQILAKAANYYLEQKNIFAEARFDIISITEMPEYKLEHLRDAFYP